MAGDGLELDGVTWYATASVKFGISFVKCFSHRDNTVIMWIYEKDKMWFPLDAIVMRFDGGVVHRMMCAGYRLVVRANCVNGVGGIRHGTGRRLPSGKNPAAHVSQIP